MFEEFCVFYRGLSNVMGAHYSEARSQQHTVMDSIPPCISLFPGPFRSQHKLPAYEGFQALLILVMRAKLATDERLAA